MNKLDLFTRAHIIILLYISMSFICTAQPNPVNITVAVAPPYSKNIDTYISQPNKIMATFLSSAQAPLDVYILGIFEGENGIRVYTDPGYKMYPPVTLLPGIPFTLTRFNLEQVFDEKHLISQGITLNELLHANGLPEDTYTICLQAFNYDTGEPVSEESPLGCSNPFLVLDLEPPVILFPADGAVIEPSLPQQLTFSWTRPPGAPDNTLFDFRLVEVLPSDRNINDAFQSAVHPVFYETTTSITSVLFGVTEPALIEGKTYACRVTAYDPARQAVFRNDGMSEVVSFIYMKVEEEK